MKIHFYDIESGSLNYRNISSIAKMDNYLLPEVDRIVRKTEDKMPILRDIIKNKTGENLYQDNHQEVLREIANCLIGRSIVFRNLGEIYTSEVVGEIRTPDGKLLEFSYIEGSSEYFQTLLFTCDNKILLPLILKYTKIKVPSDGVDGTFEEIFKGTGTEMEDLLDGLPVQPITSALPPVLYPVLVENKTDLPFITGDVCVCKTEYVSTDLVTKFPIYHFPISPSTSIIFLESRNFEKHIPRSITDENEVHKFNRLIYNCSHHYLFSNQPDALERTTEEPKEELNLYDLAKLAKN